MKNVRTPQGWGIFSAHTVDIYMCGEIHRRFVV